MSRGLTAALLAAVTNKDVIPVLLADIEFASGTIYVWTGHGSLSFNGNTYSGLGQLCGATGAHETTDLAATNVVLQLNGIPAATISSVLGEVSVGGRAVLRFGALDPTTRALIADPIMVFKGFTDVPTINDGGETASIAISVESRLRALERPRIRQYTPIDQTQDYPGDKGFDFVAELQDKQIIWR